MMHFCGIITGDNLKFGKWLCPHTIYKSWAESIKGSKSPGIIGDSWHDTKRKSSDKI